MNEITSGVAIPPKQMSQIETAFDLVGKNSRMLFDSISLLEEKLKPVLRESDKSESINEKEESLVPLAETIKRFSRDFRYANERIRSLLERLEI